MLEHFGFLKFDFLALGTLRIFENTVRKILKKQTRKAESEIPFEEVQKWFYDNLSPDNNPMDDPKVYENVFWNGNFISIFQFVKPNTQDFMRRMKPKSVKDIAIATSIHRPGPLGLKVDRDFLNNRANPESIKYEHPFLKEVLEPTSGLLIFQEQLQLIYHHLCGVPLDETDSVRKAFTKKEINNKEKAAKEREKLKAEFVEKTKTFAGLNEEKASKFFDKMEKLVAYSFNQCLHGDSLVETQTGIKKIKDVVPNQDLVNSVNGFVKVKNKFENGVKNLVKIKTKSGKELICTLDHKIQTPNGMKTVKEIIEQKLQIIVKLYQSDEIESVEFYGIEETYDLEVDHEDHTFYANNISVSNSHAISYSIATYQCSHLLTYFPDEWITACLDYAALEKGKVVGQEDPKAVAMREAQKLGYKFSKPDINFSSAGYEIHPTKEKTIVPGLTTIDGIGEAALEEINRNKPYKNIKDLLVNKDGTWKHSKFNRKALTNLICLEALDSLNFVSPTGELSNYKQAYNVIVENFDLLKKTSAKKKNNDITPILEELIKKEKELNTEDWTRAEKTKFWLELAGGADLSLILDEKYLKAIKEMNLMSVDDIRDIDFLEEGENKKITEQVWFILRKAIMKTAKTGRSYAELSVIGEKFSDLTVKVWGVDSSETLESYPTYEVYCGAITKDKYGLSTNLQKIAPLSEIYDYLFPAN